MPLEAPRSQYRQIADLIRAAIEAGEYPPGSALPAEPELCSKFGVSRLTVNRAMTLLRAEGLVHVERGRGTFVRKIPVIHRAAMSRYQQATREEGGGRGAFDGEIRRLGHTPRSEVEVERVAPPAEVAQALGLGEGVAAIARRRRMYADDEPVQLATSWIPADIADGTALAEQDSGAGGIISRFAELGYEQVRITETVRVRRAAADEQAFLQGDSDSVIEIWHTGWTAADQPVEICVHIVPAHQWALDYAWTL